MIITKERGNLKKKKMEKENNINKSIIDINNTKELHQKLLLEIKELKTEVMYNSWRKERLIEQLEKRKTTPNANIKVTEWQEKHFKQEEIK